MWQRLLLEDLVIGDWAQDSTEVENGLGEDDGKIDTEKDNKGV